MKNKKNRNMYKITDIPIRIKDLSQKIDKFCMDNLMKAQTQITIDFLQNFDTDKHYNNNNDLYTADELGAICYEVSNVIEIMNTVQFKTDFELLSELYDRISYLEGETRKWEQEHRKN